MTTDFLDANVHLPIKNPEDKRLGHFLSNEEDPQNLKVVILGFATHEGVKLNGGRTGAAQGPQAIRKFLYPLTLDPENTQGFTGLLAQTKDLGNLVLSGHLSKDQDLLGSVLAPHLKSGTIPIVLGGGHETAFGVFLGFEKAGLDMEIVNIDAHADVRPLVEDQGHSGSPFRQALEHTGRRCKKYTVAGLQPHSNSPAYIDWLTNKAGLMYWKKDTNKQVLDTIYQGLFQATQATFCLDAIDGAFAPGVSAPATDGLLPELFLHAAEQAGRTGLVHSFDLCELNPEYDQDHRTARLAALTVWRFLKGLALRGH